MAIGTALALATAASVGGAALGAKASSDAAKRQSRAITQSAQTASDATLQAQQMSVDALREGAAGVETELRDQDIRGREPERLYSGGLGLGTTQDQTDAQAGIDNSAYWKDAKLATDRGLQALASTNAAAGRGGQINSGKALRAASDIAKTYRGEATDKTMSGWAGFIDSSDAARAAIANAKLGVGSQSANVFGNTGQTQANIALGAGVQRAAIAGEQGANQAGFIGNAFGNLGNANFNGLTKRFGNVFGGGQVAMPITAGRTAVKNVGAIAPRPWSGRF